MKKSLYLFAIVWSIVSFHPTFAQVVAFSDDLETLMTWKPAIDSITGKDMDFRDLPLPSRSSKAVEMVKGERDWLVNKKVNTVFLQIGCNCNADKVSDYEKELFDYPTGMVCNLAGNNKRSKRIAVTKPEYEIDASNFAGCLYRMVKHIRDARPHIRIFILAPVKAGDEATSECCRQIAEVANMLCLPFIEDAEQLAGYEYYWSDVKPNLGKLLVLGDSYSEQRKWINSLENMSDVEVVNLGVTSATVRDRFGDRVKYPYTDNPVKTDNDGNHNTLSCQVMKLHRLLEGKQLYPGEQSLEGYRPDVIIIEGGSNDHPDPQFVVDGYVEDIRQDRRTSFAGALGFIVRDLRKTFPDAKIFITTTVGLYYGHTDRPFDFILKSGQQRAAAKMLGCPTINWDLDGCLSFVFNNSCGTGDGTEDRPFIYNVKSMETVDLLHPNEYGAQFLAESVLRWMKAANIF